MMKKHSIALSFITVAAMYFSPPCTAANLIHPVVVTDSVSVDSDDPAIWIDANDPKNSLILGTDKGGYLYVFNLQGKTVRALKQPGMQRLNNVDVEYGLTLGDRSLDIAVASDRDAGLLFAWSLPDFTILTPTGIPVFAGEAERRPMGVALYKRPTDGTVFAIASRKSGPSGSYLWQYRLRGDGDGGIAFDLVRQFGAWSGLNQEGDGEIEAIGIDDEAGIVYYSDELFGIRAYRADPDAPEVDEELAVFGTDGFFDDREGIAIVKADERDILIVSDQGASRFRAFALDEDYSFLGSVALSTLSTDGCEVYPQPLPGFPSGLFVAMSDDRTFHYYHWSDVLSGLSDE
jgi:3-phytase